ncbi:MAG: alpha/beta hydrolase [Terrimicrobiaceae bacterium]|nr:alpha/beta hydrolase [Terrimicrobiaceae bacterium]
MKPNTDASSEAPVSASRMPTMANVPYGGEERQTLDFWKASSSKPTPVVFYIHGGGWNSGDKSRIELPGGVDGFLAAGISVVSINYRYLPQTILTDETIPLPVITAAKVACEEAPVLTPLGDAARALQFVRRKAADWNIDKARIGLSGASAGACSALWLAFHDDLADTTSADSVSRESTRPWCVAVMEAQTTLDPRQMKEWTPNSRYGGHAFGFAWDPKNQRAEFQESFKHREVILPWIREFSPWALADASAPPVYLFYGHDSPAFGEEKEDPTHTANFGPILQEKLLGLGVECELVHPGAPDVKHANVEEYLVEKLTLRDV